MSFENNVKREYHMDFDIAEAANTGDDYSIFAGFPDMQPSTSAGYSSAATGTAVFSHGHLIGQMVLDVIEGFLLVVNDSAVIDFASQNIASFTDFTAEEVTHRLLYRILHDEDRQLVQPFIDAAAGAAPMSPHSSHVTLRLLPNFWRSNGTGASQQPLILDATLKIQSLAISQPNLSNALSRYLVCLMKPSQRQQPQQLQLLQQQQQQQQVTWPIKSSQSVAASPPVRAAATRPAASSVSSVGSSPSLPHSLSDFISCRHDCADSNLVTHAVCSPALASKQAVLAEFFIGRRWASLVLPIDTPIWQRHVQDVVAGNDEASSGIYRCQITGNGRMAFVKSRSHRSQQQPSQFASTHCIIRFCESNQDLQGSPSASLLRRVGSVTATSSSSSTPSLPQSPKQLQQQQQQQRSALGPRERQELLSLGALYKSCAKQDPERAAALRSRMLTLWADSQQQQQQPGPVNQPFQLPQPHPSAPLLLSSTQRSSSDMGTSMMNVMRSRTAGGRQPASLLMELLNGPSAHSCTVSITAGALQELLNAKEQQARAAEQQQVSSTTATPSTPGRKRQPSWPDDNIGGGSAVEEDADSSTHTSVGGKRKPPAGTQLLAALLSEAAAPSAAASTANANAAHTRESAAPPQAMPAVDINGGGDGEEFGMLESILRSIDEQQQQQQLPPNTVALIQQPSLTFVPPMPAAPPPPPQPAPGPDNSAGGAELPEDVVLDIILDMEERHKHQPTPDSTTPSGAAAAAVTPSAPPIMGSGSSGGGLLERLLSS